MAATTIDWCIIKCKYFSLYILYSSTKKCMFGGSLRDFRDQVIWTFYYNVLI